MGFYALFPVLFFARSDFLTTQLYTEKNLSQGTEILQNGGLVGLPTETVYGLASNGLNPQAVEKIFQVKGRPADNPLILHIASADWMSRYCKNIPPEAWTLAKHFWPGPLTLILEAKDIIPTIVTANLPTVGLRCPNHPLALQLIEDCDLPLAAPSGNLSGKPSPTTALAMFDDMDGKISGIFDGGPCSVGVESTILIFSPTPTVLRLGGVSVEDLESVLGSPVELSLACEEGKPLAPGMKYRHYAPKASITVVTGANSAQWIAEHVQTGEGVICFQEYEDLFQQYPRQILGKENDFASQAQQVFSALRYFDQTEVGHIWSQCPEGKGIAEAVAHRLEKASGFQLIHTDTHKTR